MIIKLDGYGKVLEKRKIALRNFYLAFNNRQYDFNKNIGQYCDNNSLLANIELSSSSDYYKETLTGIGYKVSDEDFNKLEDAFNTKKNSSYSTVGFGYHKISYPGYFIGDVSAIAYDVFMYLKGSFSSDYEIILVNAGDKEKTVNLSEQFYWGFVGSNSSFYFNKSEDQEKNIKYLVKDSNGNIQKVAQINIIEKEDNIPVGIKFEIYIDAIVSLQLKKDKAIYGNKAFTDEIYEFALGDSYKEKLIDAILGAIGLQIENNPNNIDIKKFINIISIICIIRNISIDELKNIIIMLFEGLDRTNYEKYVDNIIDLVINKESEFISESINTNEIIQDPTTLEHLAIYEILKKQKVIRVKNIKKPQVNS